MAFSKFDNPPETEDAGAPESEERRNFMRTAAVGAGAAVAAGAVLAGGGAVRQAAADGHEMTPIGMKWWPSRWGAEDQAGASNWMTPEKTLDAVKWISNGKVTRIGRLYEHGSPTPGARAFSMRIPSGPFGDNMLLHSDGLIDAELGQAGTRLDGLGHIGAVVGSVTDTADHRYYNGFTGAEIEGPHGLRKIGIEHVKPFFTRGHLVDVRPQRMPRWNRGEEIRIADVEAALGGQGMSGDDIKPGDAVFFNTGWGDLWLEDNGRYNSGCPGIGLEVAGWLVGKQVSVVGADTWPVEVVPNPDPKLAFAVHNELITKNGIYINENLIFDELIAAGSHRFVYVFSPVPIRGATGSIGAPIAIT